MHASQTNLVLITGALGWLGSRLVESGVRGLPDYDELRDPPAGLKVRCLVLPGQDASALQKISDRVEIVQGDVRNTRFCQEFCADARDAVLFHTAGIIHTQRVGEFYQVNVEGTKRLLDAAIGAGVRRAVVVSSNSPCGCNPHPDHLFDELSPYHPYLNYGRSKIDRKS